VADDLYDIMIHDEDGQILLHKRMTKAEAEQAILALGLVKDRPHMALIRAVLSAGTYDLSGKKLFAKRVPPARNDNDP
jgi:hypothetical protein